MRKHSVISLNICEISFNEACKQIVEWAKQKKRNFVCFANVHMVIEAHSSKTFADQVNSAALVLADGMPLVKAMSSIHKVRQERVAGMDVFPVLLKLAAEQKLKVFLYGTTPQLLEKIRTKAETEFPDIRFAGTLAPPFSRSVNDQEFIASINAAQPDLVFVALGCPKQEKWMYEHTAEINAVLLGVGGAFPVYAGEVSRAPLFMRKLSLEWVYRLFQEPRRLFKRYLITNSKYLFLITKQRLMGK
jgi:N-acetylglucosaminyldiphosphoundecaprenol N-acetyl-beta-D-mannosaminyltransferase